MKELLKSKDGFSLVELMVAMTILIIILGVTSTMFISSSDLSRRITSSSDDAGCKALHPVRAKEQLRA